MRILALDSSTDWLSVALGDGDAWLERGERAGTAASMRALPLVSGLLDEAGAKLTELDGIAFGAGPGSFTGVRIACGLAQGLALGAGIPVIGVPTLEALAQAEWRAQGAQAVFACLDARMREVYVAAYRRASSGWACVVAPAVQKPDDVARPEGDWHGCGDGFAAYPALARRLALASVDASAVPSARAIGELAAPRFAAGEGVAAALAEPLYVRHRVALTTRERDAGMRL
jgi:tRNA threonylcarbamoyladenosine biosynthesis protein TsaB